MTARRLADPERRLIAVAVLLLCSMVGTDHGRAATAPSDTLAGDIVVLPEITVTATRLPTDALDSPLPTSEVSPEQMRHATGVSLARAIDVLPGVHSLDTGEQIGKPVIRGLFGSRVLVLDDGLRMEDYAWSDEDGPAIDAHLVQRVEVIRGPASVLYGSDALGGVVNTIPAALPHADLGQILTRTGAEISARSNNAEFGLAARAEGARGRLGWRLFGVGRHGGDVHTPAGEIPNTGFGAVNGEAAVGLRGERSQARLRYVHYGGEYKLLEAGGPVMDTAEGSEEEGPERKVGDDRVQFEGEQHHGIWRLTGKTQWQRHSLIELSDEFPGTGKAEEKETTAFDLLLTTLSVDLLAHHEVSGPWHGTLGLSGVTQSGDSRGPVVLVPDTDVLSGAAFAFEELRLERWSLLAGLRHDARRLRADANDSLQTAAQTRTYDATTADVGAVFRPAAHLSLAANVGRAWRAPNIFELFANGPHIGEIRWEYGDQNLVPETSLNVDASMRWRSERFAGELSLFRNRIDDYITLAATGDSTAGLPDYRHRQMDAVLIGGEVAIAAQVMPRLELSARADYVRGSRRGSDDPLPLMPPLRGILGAAWRPAAPSWADQVRVGMQVELVAEQTRLSAFDVGVPGYVLVHVDAGFTRPVGERRLRVEIRVDNVLDHAYRDFLSRYKSFALSPGRNLALRVGWDL